MPTDSSPLLVLPEESRSVFKEPLGPIATDPAAVARDCDGTLVTVGDIVTYEFETAGHSPAVAIVDGRTAREAVSASVADVIADRGHRLSVSNPPGTITTELIEIVNRAYGHQPPITVAVDGEEDLATLPAVLCAPPMTTVVYGQPETGMVVLEVTDDVKAQFEALLTYFEGDHETARRLLT